MYEQLDLALIGSRIKAVRTGKGMSQADLAVKASVSLPLISNIERGKTRMQLETFVKVTERKLENYTLITKIYDTLSLEVLLCKGF